MNPIEPKPKKEISKTIGEDSIAQKSPNHKEGHDYSHIEKFIDGLEHPHEIEHAMNHASKKLTADKQDNEPTSESDDMKDYEAMSSGGNVLE